MVKRRMTGPERAAQLLDVAERLFVEQGYESTSVEDVARAAGVSRPMVYQHHGSKEGLYLGCVARARTGLVERTGQALVGVTDPVDALRAGAGVWFTEVERDPRRWELLHTDRVARLLARDDLETLLPNTSPFYAGAIARWARPDVTQARINAHVEMAVGAAIGLARWWTRHREVSRDDIVEELVQFCWRGLSSLLPEH